MESSSTGSTAPAPQSGPQSLESQASEVESNESLPSEDTAEQPVIEKHKVKVNGKEVEVSLDDLKKRYEHAQAANEKFQKAAEIQKQYQHAQQEITKVKGVFEQLQKSPHAFFELADALGVDLDKVAHEHVMKQYKVATMSEEERRYYDMEQKLQKYESDRERYAREEQERNRSTLAQKARVDVENELVNFFTSKQVTPTPEVLERVLSDVALFANGDMSLTEAIQRAYNRHESLMERLERQALEKAIKTGKVPDELRTQFRKADVEKLGNPFRSKPDNSRPPVEQNRSSQNRSNKPVTNSDDYFARLDRKYNGRK